MAKRRHEVRVEPGEITSLYSATEAEALAREWLSIYGSNRQGVNTKAYMWHVFSFERYPSVAADQAWEHYNGHDAVSFVVLANDRQQAFLTSERPTSCSWADCLIFPANLAWTMARTHEEGWLGPYFARHPRYAELQVENHAALRKKHEAAFAKSKGWA